MPCIIIVYIVHIICNDMYICYLKHCIMYTILTINNYIMHILYGNTWYIIYINNIYGTCIYYILLNKNLSVKQDIEVILYE